MNEQVKITYRKILIHKVRFLSLPCFGGAVLLLYYVVEFGEDDILLY